MRRTLLIFLILLSFCYGVEAIDLVDVPTAEVVDYGSFEVRFRLYSQGGVLSRLNFGVVRNMNLGIYIDMEKVIGSKDIGWGELNVPRLYLKFRLYPGSLQWPSLSMGYDAQGYINYKTGEREKSRGAYMVLTKETFFPGFRMHLGGNVSLAEEMEKFFGFLGLDYRFSDRLLLYSEYDRIRRLDEARWNIGFRYKIGPNISADFCIRDVLEETITTERILRVIYRGIF